MITFHSGFYIKSNQGERELITGETERESIKGSVGAKFRKVVLENKIEWEFLQDKMFGVDNSLELDGNASCRSGLKLMI
jgi:hypothetical protein